MALRRGRSCGLAKILKLGRKISEPDPRLFVEEPAWKAIGAGWRPMFGSFSKLGFSFEWHEFTSQRDLDWGRSFHPNSVEVCLNLDGTGCIAHGSEKVEVGPRSYLFYYQGQPGLEAIRLAGQKHRFITVEFSRDFLR